MKSDGSASLSFDLKGKIVREKGFL